MYKEIQAKSILLTSKGFDFDYYNMNLYRGCQHDCIYCNSRSKRYYKENFSEIEIKTNALELLEKEIRTKKKGIICTGNMNDPYMPIEEEMHQTRKALKIIQKHRFPLHIITKSPLVLRDIDILKKINEVYWVISITITTTNDELAKITEPKAPSPSERLKALKRLSSEGIYCGVFLMPTLPFLTDNEENIIDIVSKVAECGAKYIIYYPTITNRDGQREYMYNKFDEYFPELRCKYEKLYGEKVTCYFPNSKTLNETFIKECKKYNIKTYIKEFKDKIYKMQELF